MLVRPVFLMADVCVFLDDKGARMFVSRGSGNYQKEVCPSTDDSYCRHSYPLAPSAAAAASQDSYDKPVEGDEEKLTLVRQLMWP